MFNIGNITKAANKILTSDNINKVKKKTTELYNTELGQIVADEVKRSGDFQKLNDKYGKYVDVWNERKNFSFTPEDLIKYSTNPGSIISYAGVGMASSYSNASGLTYHPSTIMAAVKAPNMPDTKLRYPLNEVGDDYGPFMLFKAFKYTYDNYNKLGMTGNSSTMSIGEDGKSSDTQNELLTIIKLPMPAEFANDLKLGFSDYNSLMAKLVRAAKLTSADDMKNLLLGIIDKGAGSNTWEDAAHVAMAGGLHSMIQGNGFVGSAIGEGFDFVRVSAGIAINPMQQSAYNGAGNSSHSFSIPMVPRNEKEAVEINKIIEKFQWLSIGEKMEGSGGLILNYPAVWNVSFHAPNGQEITGMLGIPDAFLTGVRASYGAPGAATFKVTNTDKAWATAYTLSLELKEAQNPIRDDLNYMRQGGSLFGDEHPTSAQHTPNIFGNMSTAELIKKGAEAGGQLLQSGSEAAQQQMAGVGQTQQGDDSSIVNNTTGSGGNPPEAPTDDKVKAKMREYFKNRGYGNKGATGETVKIKTGPITSKLEVVDLTKTSFDLDAWQAMSDNQRATVVMNGIANGKDKIKVIVPEGTKGVKVKNPAAINGKTAKNMRQGGISVELVKL